jgi:hypothetical protein
MTYLETFTDQELRTELQRRTARRRQDRIDRRRARADILAAARWSRDWQWWAARRGGSTYAGIARLWSTSTHAINAAHVKSRIDKIDRILRWHRRHGGVLDLAAGRGVLQDGSTPEGSRG